MNGTKSWSLHMAAGVALVFLLGLHMWIMHMGAAGHWYAPYGADPDSIRNSLFRDGSLYFTVIYVLLLGIALYHGLFGLRTILFELTLKPATEKALTVFLLLAGLGLFALGAWATITAHGIALAASRG